MQNFRGSTFCPKEENGYFEVGWDGLEQPSNRYDPRGRDLSWDYSDASISYEGSYLPATNGTNGNVVVTRRGKSKGGRQKVKVNSTQTPYRNKTSVSVDKETQMIPQKANTSLREIVSKGVSGTVIQSVKTGSIRKKRKG